MHLEEFLLAAVVLLAVTAAAVFIFKRIGLGSILGFLVAGVLLGPSGFTITHAVDDMLHFTELGVVLLLFIIGLEMQPRKLWAMRHMVFGFGTLQVLVTGAALAAFGMLLGDNWRISVLLGLGLALSSTAFVLQLLNETNEFATKQGQAAFSILLMQDIAIVPLLMLVPILADTPMPGTTGDFYQEISLLAGTVVAVLVVGRYLVPIALSYAARVRNMEAFSMVGLVAALGAALAMQAVGASMALGAFLMGMMLSASPYRHQIEADVEPFKGALLGLFFISVGMSVDVGVVIDNALALSWQIVVILVIKGTVLAALALAFGLGRAMAVRLAFLLPQSGEFGFVLFGAAIGAGILSPELFALVAVLISVSMAATPVLNTLGKALAARLEDRPVGGADGVPPPMEDKHVVVAGYGRVGRAVCMMLELAGTPYIAVDRDPSRVRLGKQQGHHVYYGNVGDSGVQSLVRLGKAAAVAVTLGDVETANRLVSVIKTMHPAIPVLARAESVAQAIWLKDNGATTAVPVTVEASLALGGATLQTVGATPEEVASIQADLRRDDYSTIVPTAN